MSYKVSVLLFIGILSIFPLFAQNSIITQIDSLITPLAQKGANIGIDIRDISHDSTFYAVNSKAYMTPASVQKLFITAVSLMKFGENYQFKTPITYSGKLKKNKIKGD
ncbi:MAG TPA: D-alanyl-D-alanine carboxypeptidase, partial [Candidatus Cloacimonadota bacterium]|nr:D-alanyl-D-alanine carboxypeptidase [Candidatus Cloacimonadota bacterium]